MISTKEELQFLLHRGLEIEKKFESLSALQAFVAMGSPDRKIVLSLVRDSYQHRLELEKLLKMLEFGAPTDELPGESFNFNGMLDSEILQKIVEQDEIAKDLYSEIAKKTDPRFVKSLLKNKNVDFFQTLNGLIDDEERHIKMIKAHSGTIVRVS